MAVGVSDLLTAKCAVAVELLEQPAVCLGAECDVFAPGGDVELGVVLVAVGLGPGECGVGVDEDELLGGL